MSTRFAGGYLTLGRVRGVAVRVHWTWPLGAAFFTRGMNPLAWLAFATITLVHEFGHAYLAQRFRLRVDAVELQGYGGLCRYRGEPTPVENAVIAWGGVLAEGLLLLAALALAPWADRPVVGTLRSVFLWTNLQVIAFNLLPIRPLDGAEAWRLPGLWLAALREQREYLRARADATRAEDAARLRRRQRAAQLDASTAPVDGTLPPEVEAQLDAAMRAARMRMPRGQR